MMGGDTDDGGKQRYRGERAAGWPGREPASLGPRVIDKPLAKGASEARGLRSYRGLLLPPQRPPPLPHKRPQPGKPHVHLLIWTWLSDPKPGTQGLTMNWILNGGEWRGGYTLHSNTSPGGTLETPSLTVMGQGLHRCVPRKARPQERAFLRAVQRCLHENQGQ